MEAWEETLWLDQVPVTNRSAGKSVEFTYDGKLIYFNPGETRSLPRHLAVFGIEKTPIRTDPHTGEVLDSFLTYPGSSIGATSVSLDPVAVAAEPKTLEATVAGDLGVPKKLKKFGMAVQRESFAQNNEGGGADLVGTGEK